MLADPLKVVQGKKATTLVAVGEYDAEHYLSGSSGESLPGENWLESVVYRPEAEVRGQEMGCWRNDLSREETERPAGRAAPASIPSRGNGALSTSGVH